MSATARRIQLRRTKGWRKPADAVVVARPTRWGNPFPIDGDWMVWTAVGLGYSASPAGRRAAAVALHRAWLTNEPVALGPHAHGTDGGVLEFSDGTQRTMNDHVLGIARSVATLRDGPVLPARPPVVELRGHDLACWCPLDLPCHADVLLEIANA